MSVVKTTRREASTTGASQSVSGPGRRVTFVIEALTVGGAERMVVDLANELAERGDLVSVICLSGTGELAASLSSKVTLHLLNKKTGIDLSILKRLRKLVKSLQPDVVNSHLWTANLWTRLALLKLDIPVVVTEHNRDVWKRSHNRFIDRVLSHATASMIAVSDDTASFYKSDVGIRKSLISVVNNGVDTHRYAAGDGSALRRLWIQSDELLIGTVGRLTRQKNHIRLIEAAAKLESRGLNVFTVIAGEGPERANIQSCIDEHKLNHRIRLLGERSDIPELLSALDIFVLSSDREGHPLSALEAQAAGTPVILTDAGGSSDAVSRSNGQTGGMIVEKTATAIADAVEELGADPSRLRQMASFASSYARKHFDTRTMVKHYSDAFDNVIMQGPDNQQLHPQGN